MTTISGQRTLPRWGLQLSERRVLLLVGDVLTASTATVLALWLWTLTSPARFSMAYLLDERAWFFWLVGGWLVLSADLYDLGRAASPVSTLQGLLVAAGVGLGLYLGVYFFSPPGSLPRLVVLYFIGAAFCLALVWRLLYIAIFVSHSFRRRVLAAVTARWWLPAIGYWLAQPSRPGQADAIVVLSGGGPERSLHGIALYQQGLAPQIWITGDAPLPQMPLFTDGQFARDFAIQQGVPAIAIRLLATTSTWEDAREIAAEAKRTGARSILVVTSWYHGRRALCVIRHHLAGSGIALYYSASTNPPYRPEDWWQNEEGLVAVINELIRFGFYWARYGLVPWSC